MEPKIHAWILGGNSSSSLQILQDKKVTIHYIINETSVIDALVGDFNDWVLFLNHKDEITIDLFDILQEKDDVDLIVGLYSTNLIEKEGLSGTFIRYNILMRMNLQVITNEVQIFEVLFKMEKQKDVNCNNSQFIPLKIVHQNKAHVQSEKKEKIINLPYSSFFKFQSVIEALNRGIRYPPQEVPQKMEDMIELKKRMDEFRELSSLLENLIENGLVLSEYVNSRINDFDQMFK
jgi:hypothetical protein